MVFWEDIQYTNLFIYITFSFSRYLNLNFIRYFEYILSKMNNFMSEALNRNVSCCKDNVNKKICNLHSIVQG